MANAEPSADRDDFERCRAALARWREVVRAAVVGLDDAIEPLLSALLAGGQVMIAAPPGVGKTTALRAIAAASGLRFERIGCTSDLTFGDLLREPSAGEDGSAEAVPGGPLFAQVFLADDFDLASPKLRAAVLQAVGDGRALIGGRMGVLPPARLFVAAFNSLLLPYDETPLTQSQRDRFLFSLRLGYPNARQERRIAARSVGADAAAATAEAVNPPPVLQPADLLAGRRLVRTMPCDERVTAYAAALVRASRPATRDAAEFVDKWVAWGAGPRGLTALLLGAKARALLNGRAGPTIDDVVWLAPAVLRHRIEGNEGARASNLTSDRLIAMLLESVPPEGDYSPPSGRELDTR